MTGGRVPALAGTINFGSKPRSYSACLRRRCAIQVLAATPRPTRPDRQVVRVGNFPPGGRPRVGASPPLLVAIVFQAVDTAMKSNAPGHFQRRLKQRNPYLFVEYWKEGERPFNWFAEWEHLSVEISDIRVAIRHQYLTRNSLSDAQSIPLAKINEDAVPENIPNDQKKAYLEFVFRLFNEAFTKPDSQETLMISGMFATENDSIGFIRSGETEGKRTQKGYI